MLIMGSTQFLIKSKFLVEILYIGKRTKKKSHVIVKPIHFTLDQKSNIYK